MKEKDKSILNFIKVRMRIMLIAIIGVAVLLVSLAIYSLKVQYTSRQSVNVLGRQRMYSQMIAREANRYFIINQKLLAETDSKNKNSDLERLKDAREKIITASKLFSDIFQSAKSGNLKSNGESIDITYCLKDIESQLHGIEREWQALSGNVELLLSESHSGSNYENINTINEASSNIMNLSDSITDTVVNSSKIRTTGFILLCLGLGLILIISIIFMLYNIDRYLILPLGELYRGMTEIGLTSFVPEAVRPTRRDMGPIVNEMGTILNKLNKLIELIENLNFSKSFTDVLGYIYNNFSSFIPYNHIGIAFVENEGRSLRAAYGISDKGIDRVTQNLFGLTADIRSTSLDAVLRTGETRIIGNLKEHVKGRETREYNKILIESGICSSITLPLKIRNKPVGIIFFSSTEANVYTKEHEKFLKTIANSIAICLEKNIFVDDLLYSSILALAALAESRDGDTGEHLNRMKKYSSLIGSLLLEDSSYSEEISLEYINDLERFSPLHDIGKVAIRDEILLKPGKLTREEFEIMKSHAIFGARVLKAAESNVIKNGRSVFKLGIEIAEGHHEKWDGSGYPYGKVGKEIPLSARIVAVADVFDALTSKRPYKDPFSLEQSFKIVEEGSGTHFDPEIVRVFLRNRESVESLYNSMMIENPLG